ncbi:4Fe-4S dicluster domain-containing protein [Acidaminobacter sp. JC074]|uniref:4Fe-4S binding protein n=1 Tax=Acidaminobacter sp. JC074 TaxID=2530199 RepID=UPI001F0D9AC2|nr:4Fe-4S binding protein [Acidaminobacter sp. JC074]MCH4886434.1 4Fe-4S dicluster domain-containing protein [Acidaminobacter sp. JC074]
MKVKVDQKRCKQCELCAVNCPKEAISFTETFNEFGYRTTQIENDKCIACGMCYIMCPDGVYEVLG